MLGFENMLCSHSHTHRVAFEMIRLPMICQFRFVRSELTIIARRVRERRHHIGICCFIEDLWHRQIVLLWRLTTWRAEVVSWQAASSFNLWVSCVRQSARNQHHMVYIVVRQHWNNISFFFFFLFLFTPCFLDQYLHFKSKQSTHTYWKIVQSFEMTIQGGVFLPPVT